MSKKTFRKADLILILGILIVAIAAAGIIWMTRKAGASVQVSVSGKVIASYPLDEDRVEVIEGAYGGHNTLTIEDGQAWLSEATCPDKLCEYMGKISQDNETIVCLPNEVVVEIVDEDGAAKSVDGVSGGR